jgi:hypothetical protein
MRKTEVSNINKRICAKGDGYLWAVSRVRIDGGTGP